MTRDQAIGAAICAICVLVLVGYLADIIIIAITGAEKSWISWLLNDVIGFHTNPTWVLIWLIGIPVVIAFCVVLAIGAWIGWTMATTPPPAPIEELEAELREEEEKIEEEKAEEKPEEKKEEE